jgi:hypothetical protein
MSKKPAKKDSKKKQKEKDGGKESVFTGNPAQPKGPRFVVGVSHDGPYEIQVAMINDIHLVPTTVTTTKRLYEIPIPSAIQPPFRVMWWIVAGHKIPRIATGIALGDEDPVTLDVKAPLAKGESWLTKKPVKFPKEDA